MTTDQYKDMVRAIHGSTGRVERFLNRIYNTGACEFVGFEEGAPVGSLRAVFIGDDGLDYGIRCVGSQDAFRRQVLGYVFKSVFDRIGVPEQNRPVIAETLMPYDFSEKEIYEIVNDYMVSGELPNPEALLDRSKNREDVQRRIHKDVEDIFYGAPIERHKEPPSVYDAIEPRNPDLTQKYDPSRLDVEWSRPFSYRWMVSGSTNRALRGALILGGLRLEGNAIVEDFSGNQVGVVNASGIRMFYGKRLPAEVRDALASAGMIKKAQEEPDEPTEDVTPDLDMPEEEPFGVSEEPVEEEPEKTPPKEVAPGLLTELSEMDREIFVNLEAQRQKALEDKNYPALQYVNAQEELLLKKYIGGGSDVISPSSLLGRLKEAREVILLNTEEIVRKASGPLKFVRGLGASVKGFSVYSVQPERGVRNAYDVEFVVTMSRGPVYRSGILKVAVKGDTAELLPWVWSVTGRAYPLDSSGMDGFFDGYRSGATPPIGWEF